MTHTSMAYGREFKPIKLKELMVACDIRQGDLAEATGLKRPTINLAVNRGWLPVTCQGFKSIIEQFLTKNKAAKEWLAENKIEMQEIWRPLKGDVLKQVNPVGAGKRQAAEKRRKRLAGEYRLTLGDPENNEFNQEVEMIRGETLKHFRLIRSPFVNDIRDITDIYMSDEHRYIEAAMIDAAKHGGFIAVMGEVGSGKSVIRKKVVAELQKDESMRIIYPRMIDKTKVTAVSLCDAIIMDLSDEKPQQRLEQKTRQVEKLLISRIKAGCKMVLLVEEAHDLTVKILKLLKRFYEIEDGYKKALGIVLIGQPELGAFFNEGDHYDMREVIRRCQIAEIRGLNGNMAEYLTWKFRRAGVDIKAIITDEAIVALSKRLTDKDSRGRSVSNAYPLTVNNYIIRAMNAAYEMGEAKVTEDVVMGI